MNTSTVKFVLFVVFGPVSYFFTIADGLCLNFLYYIKYVDYGKGVFKLIQSLNYVKLVFSMTSLADR